ncbi:peptide-methionine (S)-S-oxide reductase [Candidatus Nitrosopumilus sp. SW]|uniref:peptide-methionine (S)-S-oxide reductase MsrA n=1 Tax=Candidatus Nitrosopumilus sp. SW TaxID=2508726 RepID=UPI001152E41D|nr:peptide-methionine (S)-S-oxide reductase MsrA [Candidatus Nitrosopumilus sp. SW]QDI89546.1 peptide-methionine (S)-S-oxide reductase [Candidatus Nitrosopumilus sp. SW]
MKATFGAGCFWHVEDLLSKTKGVRSTKVGYIGGNLPNPTYEEVCTDRTGHAEAVEVEYDPDEISYEELLDVFWNNHNPTTLNRQGPDVGIQYRSAIFYHDEKQKEIAEKSKSQLDSSGKFNSPIVTEITPAPTFYKAEEYHQKYFKKNGF